MPLQEPFWALRFGVLVDRFGIPWMVNCERPAEALPYAARGLGSTIGDYLHHLN
jgi:hypothetical protein